MRKNLKRTANPITSVEEIKQSDDTVLDISKKIFFEHFSEEYTTNNYTLYEIPTQSHSKYPNITSSPHFVRDDGVMIYLDVIDSNDVYLARVSDETIHVGMQILKIKKTIVCEICLNTSIDDIEDDVDSVYDTIESKVHEYSKEMSKQYIYSLTRKKYKKSSEKTGKESKSSKPIEGFNPSDWVSASKTRNYVLNDTLIDWLEYKDQKNTHHTMICEDEDDVPTENYNFDSFLMNKGKDFESKIIKLLKEKVKSNEFVTICQNGHNYHKRILEYEEHSTKEIMKGTPIIYQPVLMNRTGKLAYSYGMPDLLVRSDYLSKLISFDPIPMNLVNHRAPKLNGDYHYVVVDIKFTTLELCSDGARIRNSGNFPAYKCQLYIYNHALGQIQGYEPKASYILGRRYKYQSLKKIFSNNNCFDKVGEIQYNGWDKTYVTKAMRAIKWIKRLRLNGKKWKLFPTPSIKELYPNMCSNNDTKYNDFKASYAKKIGDITLLWNCGVKHRTIAHKNKVFSIYDDKCCAHRVGINGPIQGPILNAIVNINHQTEFDSPLDRISMDIDNHYDNDNILESDFRITVDFETISSVFDDFKNLPIAGDMNILFMIGVSYKYKLEPANYKMFLLSELTMDAEFQLIHQFYQYLREMTTEYLGKTHDIPALCHYGHIERSHFTNLCKRLKHTIGLDVVNDVTMIESSISWFDLYAYFKKKRIVVNGCYKFGLKEIAGRLNELGLINIKWDKTKLADHKPEKGVTAMLMAYEAYRKAAANDTPINKFKIMHSIMEYNKVDCLVIHEIMKVLKQKIEDSLIDESNESASNSEIFD